jgi:predicted PurR-regulated permease PerM
VKIQIFFQKNVQNIKHWLVMYLMVLIHILIYYSYAALVSNQPLFLLCIGLISCRMYQYIYRETVNPNRLIILLLLLLIVLVIVLFMLYIVRRFYYDELGHLAADDNTTNGNIMTPPQSTWSIRYLTFADWQWNEKLDSRCS